MLFICMAPQHKIQVINGIKDRDAFNCMYFENKLS